ncbi:MAG: aldehyde dehydrogenase family protein [Pseudomonadota bacterium]
MSLEQAQIEALRSQAVAPASNFIAGIPVAAVSEEMMESVSPLDGAVLTRIPASDAADIDAAVAAARRAFPGWAGLAPGRRGRILQEIGARIEAEAAALAVLGVRDNGTEIAMAAKAEPLSAAATFRYYGELADKGYGEIAPTAPGALGLVHREPLGVVGAIVPWNFPLMIGAWKVAAALAVGNTVVLKPAETASLTLLRLAQICAEAGLPDGVFNVVSGTGAAAGDALARHMDVDALAFTGSGATGRKLMEAAAQSNLKRVSLELGGKSPLVVFADAPDLEVAAKAAVNAIFRNAGQVCVAASRLLVEAPIHTAFTDRVCALAAQMRLGDPLDLRTQSGAIASKPQMESVLAAIDRGHSEGAELRLGGRRRAGPGFFIEPTIFDNAPADGSLVQREIFGPVLAVQPFATEDEAVALANGTAYGLAAGVFTADLARAHRMVGRLRAGVVHVNTYGGADLTVPLGGIGQSGNGHDKSPHALDKYTNLKTAWIAL